MFKKSLLLGDAQEHFSKTVSKRLHNPLLKESHPLFSLTVSPSSLQELQTPGGIGWLSSSKVIKSFSVHSLTMDTDQKQLKQIQINTPFTAIRTLWITQLWPSKGQSSEYAGQTILKKQPPRNPQTHTPSKEQKCVRRWLQVTYSIRFLVSHEVPPQSSQKLEKLTKADTDLYFYCIS